MRAERLPPINRQLQTQQTSHASISKESHPIDGVVVGLALLIPAAAFIAQSQYIVAAADIVGSYLFLRKDLPAFRERRRINKQKIQRR